MAMPVPGQNLPYLQLVEPLRLVKEPTSKDPNIGPVHEKETMARVSAIKNIPIIFPVPALASALPEKLPGNVIS